MVPHRFGTTLVLSAVLLFPPVLAAQQHGVDKSYFDTTCAPCTDFFTFATGGWMKTATIPAAYTNTGTFRELADRNTDALHEVLDDVLAHARTLTDPTQKKLGAYYATCMDSSRADKDGAAPLKPELQRIDGIKSRADLLAEIARLHGMGVGARSEERRVGKECRA